jgi:hypothetical protein
MHSTKTPDPLNFNSAYDGKGPSYSCRRCDDVFIFPADGGAVAGVLKGEGMVGKTCSSDRGPRSLWARPEKPIAAAGASGSPIILKRTGSVIGVLLKADDPKEATHIGF